MKLQFDHTVRLVSDDNLRAMCEFVSGHCHRYTLDKITKNFAYVTYSNPDEYGVNFPITAVYPVISYAGGRAIVLTLHKVIHATADTDDCEGQSFDVLSSFDGTMWRNPENNTWICYRTNAAGKQVVYGSPVTIETPDTAATAIFHRPSPKKDTTRDAGAYKVIKL